MIKPGITRRTFLKAGAAVGTGLAAGLPVGWLAAQDTPPDLMIIASGKESFAPPWRVGWESLLSEYRTLYSLSRKAIECPFHSLEGCVLFLGSKSVNDIYVFAHGSPYKWNFDLQEPSAGSTGATLTMPRGVTYEELLKAPKAPLRIPASTSPGVMRTLHLMGCSLGASRKYLRAIKWVLGDQVRLVAPRHIPDLMPCFFPPPEGLTNKPGELFPGELEIEFLRCSYRVESREAITTRENLIDAFEKCSFTFVNFEDGAVEVPVDATKWDLWIPKPWSPAWGKFRERLGFSSYQLLLCRLQGENYLDLPYEQYLPILYLDGVDCIDEPITNGSVNVADAKSVAACLEKLPHYKPDYPFGSTINIREPRHEQYGKSSVEEFVNAWRWTNLGTVLHGTRYLYELQVPIVSQGLGILPFNYHFASPPHLGLKESNPALFETV